MLKKRGERDTLPALIELTVLGGDKRIKINLLYRMVCTSTEVGQTL